LFCEEGASAVIATTYLANIAARLGISGCEIFPKQTGRVNEQNVGNWINLPYFGDARNAAIEASKLDIDPYSKLFVFIGLNTAMRHMEILKARFENIDFDTKRLFIPDAKAGGRYQPLTNEIIDVLIEHQKKQIVDGAYDGWVFSSPESKTGHRTYMAKQFNRILVAAGLCTNEYSPHAMRHTCISRLVSNNVNLNTVMKISGHKSLTMVLRYTHIADQDVDEAIEAASIKWEQ